MEWLALSGVIFSTVVEFVEIVQIAKFENELKK